MDGSLLQVSVPETTAFQQYFALVVLLTIIVAIIYLVYTSRYAKLDREYRRAKSQAVSERYKATPNSLRIPTDKNPKNYRAAIHSLLDGKEPDRETVRSASGKVYGELRKSWDPVLGQVPRTVLRSLSTAALVTVFGAIAVSTSALVTLLTRESRLPTIDEFVADLSYYTDQLVVGSVEVVSSFPYGGFLYDLAFAYGILLIEWVYNNWPALAISLIVVGIALLVLKKSKIEEPGRLFDSAAFGYKTVIKVVIVWGFGVIPTVFLSSLGFPAYGSIAGFGAAVLTTFYIASVTAYEWWDDFEEFPREEYGYLAVRTAGNTLITVGWVMITLYVGNSILTGKFVEVGVALLNAPLLNKVVVTAIVLLPAFALGYQARNASDVVYDAFIESSSRAHVKSKAFGQGLPYVGIVFGYIASYSFLRSIPTAVLIAISAGIITRLTYVGMMKAKRGRDVASVDPTPDGSVVVETMTLDIPVKDGSSEERYLVVLNGSHELAWDDKGELVSDVVERATELSATGEVKPSLQSWYASDLFEYGIFEPEETVRRLDEKARKSIVSPLRESGTQSIPVDDVKRDMDDIPPDIVDSKITELARRSVVERYGDYLTLKRDPWTG